MYAAIFSYSSLAFIFSKYLNRKWIYRFLRIHIVIITVYLFFNFFIDVCIFAGIKYKEFPDLYSLYEDPIFNYTDDKLWKSSYSLEKYIIKDTQKIDLYLINNTFYNYTHLDIKNGQIYVSDPQYFRINFNEEIKGNLKSYQKRHRSEFNIIIARKAIVLSTGTKPLEMAVSRGFLFLTLPLKVAKGLRKGLSYPRY